MYITGGIEVPALWSFWGDDVREKHLCNFAEIKQLIPAAAQCYVQIWSILVQGSLLQMLRTPGYCYTNTHKEKIWQKTIFF